MYFSFDDCNLRSSSDESVYKSDDSDEDEEKIDSDIETALYSQIHHQENPFYEPAVEEMESVQANDDSNNQGDDKDQSVDSALNKDNVTPFTITISDESDVCNADDSNNSDIQFICETKNKINSENGCEIYDDDKNHRNTWWKNFVSSTYNDDGDDVGDKLLEDEKNSDDDNNSDKNKGLTKLKQSVDLKATSVVLPRSNKRTKKSSTSKAKGNAIKCAPNRKLSDSSEDSAFKHQQGRTEGRDVLINAKPSVVTVDLTEDEDLWQLCSKDVYKNKQDSRYYNKKDRIICNNCSERGHISRDCKMPKKLSVCYLCGKVGHEGKSCLNPACTICLSVGHTRRQCEWHRIRQCPWRESLVKKCPLCKMPDHLLEECPDKWRRYHMTIAPGPIIYGNSCRNNNVYCYNCARKGHFGHECNMERMDEDTYPTSPFISQYCEPVDSFSGGATMYKTAKERRLTKQKHNAINKSNKQFEKKIKRLHCKTERSFKLPCNPSAVKRKKSKKTSKNTSENQIDLSVASSSQTSDVVCSPPKKKRRKKVNSVLQQTESHQRKKVKKSKKKKSKLQSSNIKTELIQGDKIKASNGDASSIAATILRSLMPPDLRFSMKCMNLFSGKTS